MPWNAPLLWTVEINGNALTIKYDPNGNQLWTAPYAGAAVSVDTNGNIGVTGFGTNFDSVKISPSGTNLWQQSFTSSCGSGVGQAIIADPRGNFYVAGNYPHNCYENFVFYEMLIIKYGTNGNQLWANGYQVKPQDPVQVSGMMLDSANNLYVVGNFMTSIPQIEISKYASTGALV